MTQSSVNKGSAAYIERIRFLCFRFFNEYLTKTNTEKVKRTAEIISNTSVANASNVAARSAATKGYETFFLRPGKTDSAIEVVERENSVIDLEQSDYDYVELTNENYIVASMAQNTFMKESEDFAALIQKHLQKTLKNKTKNRGVKQAGFYVLVGATMPNVLVEVGFISNKEEAKNLSKSYYKRQIAESIYQAIVDFKVKYEKPLLKP